MFLGERRLGVSPARLMDLAMAGHMSLLNIDWHGRKAEGPAVRVTSGPIMIKSVRPAGMETPGEGITDDSGGGGRETET